MRIWTKQPGLPVLRVSGSYDESGNVMGLRLFQQRSLTNDVAKEEDASSDTIYPLRFATRHRHGIETVDMNTRSTRTMAASSTPLTHTVYSRVSSRRHQKAISACATVSDCRAISKHWLLQE
ncbi:hypothetical protein LB503_011821 [Fusarium chuoi]|nr:hypothetical protein LB503_011821 [Fusarium chuoi]